MPLAAGNVVGGAMHAAHDPQTGGARNGGVLPSRFGRLARFAGRSEGPQVAYLTFAPADADREASMVDGGDGADATHLRPR